jgi:hypothetical protein
MSLPKAYNRHMMKALRARAVWMPGDNLTVGKVVQRAARGVFEPVAKLEDYGVNYSTSTYSDKSLDLRSSGVTEKVFQFDVQVDQDQLDLEAEAKVVVEFKKEFEFALKTPTLKGTNLEGLAQIGQALAGAAHWKHDKHFLVYESYEAGQFTFLGTQSRASKIEVSGKGSGIISFLTAGASVGLKKSGKTEVDLVGAGGPVAMNLVRITQNGELDFDL